MSLMRAVAGVVGLAAVGSLFAGCCLISQAPTCSFTVSPNPARAGQPVTFMAQATGGSAPYTYQWSFGGSGATAVYTFPSPGTHSVMLTVTDSCGKSCTTMQSVTVTEGDDGGSGNLRGTWRGSIYDRAGRSYELSLRLDQAGANLMGTVYLFGYPSPGSGTFIAGRFMFSFQWPGSRIIAYLVGTYNAALDELRGDLVVGGDKYGTWDVRR